MDRRDFMLGAAAKGGAAAQMVSAALGYRAVPGATGAASTVAMPALTR